MQIRVQLATGLCLALALTTACGKSGGGSSSPEKPKKPVISTPALPVSGGVAEPVKPTPEPVKPTPEPVKPTPEPVKPTPEPVKPTPEPVKPVVSEKFPNGMKGVWGLAIAQKPRACSSFYDFRNSETLNVHLLCPSLDGRSISLQSETFTRMADDGVKASFKRVSSTCGISPTAPGAMFVSYKKDPIGKLQLIEGTRTSPLLDAIDPANLAGDLSSAATLHGRAVVRGCFKSGNLQNFEAVRG